MAKKEDLEEKIKLVKDIKRFAVKELCIAPNHAFTRMANFGSYYVIYASRKDSIDSLLSGQYHNKILTDESKANTLLDKLRSDGYDTLLAKIEATGSVNAPITRSLLNRCKTTIAYMVFHEMIHIHRKLRGISLSASIEEGSAHWFAHKASLQYFQSHPKMIASVRRYHNEAFQLFSFVSIYLQKLNIAYIQSFERGRQVLRNAGGGAQRLVKNVTFRHWRDRLTVPINNAFFVRYGLYATGALIVYNTLRNMDPKEYVVRTGAVKNHSVKQSGMFEAAPL